MGELEDLILSAAALLGKDAYGAATRALIETTDGRTRSLGVFHTTLDRFEAEALVRIIHGILWGQGQRSCSQGDLA